jgi:hypothetical protein
MNKNINTVSTHKNKRIKIGIVLGIPVIVLDTKTNKQII